MKDFSMRNFVAGFVLSLAFSASTPEQLLAQQLDAIRYVVRIPAPKTHYLEVEATYPTARRPTVDLMMAVWTPGSYLVREFARHLENIRAHDSAGRTLEIHKTRKNRWQVQTGGASSVVVTYRVYANEHAPRLNSVDEEFALINGAPTYITLLETAHRPHDVTLELPSSWRRSLTSLPAASDGRTHHYQAVDYDALVDSPIIAGNPAVHEFSVDGVPHALVNVGETAEWDGARSARDVEKIVQAARGVWKALPYQRYLFINILTDSYDGIEHKGSTVLFADRRSTRTENAYHDWIGLATHEFFHAWNVKRLRPVELGPFDYENEVYTKSLWVAEGLSDYYSFILPSRAGLASAEGALADLSGAIRSLQTTPGRRVQPLEMAAYDAWIKQYRPDDNSANVSISYYTKGSVVGLLLDAKVRHMTNDAKTLDDVLRLAFQRYSGARGYTPLEFRAVASEVAGGDLGEFFRRALETTEELDYGEMLEWYGLRFASPDSSALAGWSGIATRTSNGRALVARILRDTPAYGSGLNADDEIVAVDDARLAGESLDARLSTYRPGSTVTLLISRRDELRRVELTLGAAPTDRWTLSVRSDATAEQKAHLAALLSVR
ncbi:MAG: PDZ domain-containing protein [bacterium]